MDQSYNASHWLHSILHLGLGTWQLQRLQWKVALIDELEEKLQLQPLSLPKRIQCGSSLFGFAPSSEQWKVFQSYQTSYFEGFC
jgi:hypothetical protein